jgi:hypothetical protein
MCPAGTTVKFCDQQHTNPGHQQGCICEKNAKQYMDAGHRVSRRAMHKTKLPENPGPQQASRGGATVYVDDFNSVNQVFNTVNDSTAKQLTPTQTISSDNYFGILQDEYEEDDDDVTVVISNLSRDKEQCNNVTVDTADMTEDDSSIEDEFSTIKVTEEHNTFLCKTLPSHDKHYAMFDSGTTAHFLVHGAPVINTQLAKSPLRIKLPDGSYIQSTHTCNLNIPWLPNAVNEVHIVPHLGHSSLISARKFCDAGFQNYLRY